MSTQGYVLGPTEGEHLIRNAGSILIKVAPTAGSNTMALGTQQIPIGACIKTHQHRDFDEVLFILEGSGVGILGDTQMPLEKHSLMYIAKGTWHAIENPDSEILLLWIVTPPGLENFFRDVATPPDAPPKPLTHDELNAIAEKHHMHFI